MTKNITENSNILNDIIDYLERLQIYCIHVVQANNYSYLTNQRILNIPSKIQSIISEINYLYELERESK